VPPLPAGMQVGENVTVEETPEEIIIHIKKDHRGERSSSGKTVRVASTLGNKKIGNTEIFLGLNAYVKG